MFGSRRSLSRHSLHRAFHLSRSPHAGSKKEAAMKQAIEAAEVGLGAFGMGYVNGRYGAIDVAGVPLDLGVGVALQTAAFMGLGGSKLEGHLENLGNGAIAAYLTKLGAGFGAKARATKGLAAPTASRSAFAPATWAGDSIFGAENLRAEEISAMAQASR